jgi:hypothetical protein
MALVSGFYGSAIAPAGTTTVMWKGSPEGSRGGGRGTRGGRNDQETDGGRPSTPEPEPGEVVQPDPGQEDQER